ncbi:MAG: bifunctional aspartate kinase/homoserine dehydrogenase I, partial [Gemmatimonadetes bacterium]|nr:bifunctional aspartate kinase/homoserine dehydrogenase I [Gemmatimonadota bacterium]
HGVSLLREATPRTLDRILSAGERASSLAVAAAFRAAGMPALATDARELIVTGAEFGSARVLEAPTRERIRAAFEDPAPLRVVTGFVAATEQGETTTLGRGGSDYTASILGDALDAEAVELWTDVDGVLTADPRAVPAARALAALGYDELLELSHFGAKVVHPPSVHPTRRRGIPLLIKNTFHPEVPGTRVTADPPRGDETPIRGLASIRDVTLLRLEGDGMVGVPGIAARLFGALARHRVSVIMISQASSEHSICFAVAPDATEPARHAVEEEFAAERRAGLVDALVVERDLSVIAAVGEGMRERAGVAGRLFGVLGRRGVNVRAIAQGSSEINISLVVGGGDERRALNAVHDAFFGAGERQVRLYLAGPGGVGRALLAQVAAREAELVKERGYRLIVAGLADSRGARMDPEGWPASEAVARLRETESREPLAELVAAAARDPQAVFVDCSASAAVAATYPLLLAAGTPVVTANKLRPAGPLADWRALRATPARFRFETTVGAALPVVTTMSDLVATGDEISKVDGVLSGTLAYVFDEVANGRRFSGAVRKAHDLGYTEPDPREDLGGRDAGRKILILARLAGWEFEPADVSIEPVLPSGKWNEYSVEEFWKRLPDLDDAFELRQREAASRGERLVYLASATSAGASAGLVSVPADHPAATLRGTDSLVAIRSRRYASAPLVVRGPGAGPELTASGVFADILRAVSER